MIDLQAFHEELEKIATVRINLLKASKKGLEAVSKKRVPNPIEHLKKGTIRDFEKALSEKLKDRENYNVVRVLDS